MNNQQNKATKPNQQTAHKTTVLKMAISALLMAGSMAATAAQDITAKEAEQINAELAPVVNPQANAEKVGSVPEDPAAVVGTRFGYQGTLRLSGDRAQGPYDFRFRLFSQSAGGSQLGSTQTKSDLPVTDGLFDTELDFGQTHIGGDDIFLQIEVRDGASAGSYTVLSPRQRINATPYAVRALVGGDGGGGSSPWSLSGTVVSYEGGNVRVGIGLSNGTLTVNSPAGASFPLIVRVNGSSRMILRENGGLTIGSLAPDTPAPDSGLIVSGRTELRDNTDASLGGTSGVLVLGPVNGENLAMDGNEILARDNGSASTLYVGAEGGSTVNSTTGHGVLAVGGKSGDKHLSLDNNEIQAKDGNATGLLYLNFWGGDVRIGNTNATTHMISDIKQSVSRNGALKAAVYMATCGGTGTGSQPITRQYNGVSSTAITATKNGNGKCIIDFPFTINGRFWSVSAANGAGATNRSAMCDVSSADKLSCARFDTQTDSVVSGRLMLLVY